MPARDASSFELARSRKLTIRQLDTRTSPALLLLIGVLMGAITLADSLTPLGLAVWVFYALPMGVCLFARMPLLPLGLAAIATASTALNAFVTLSSPLVARWIGLTNRSMYILTLWPVAYMVHQLMLARQSSEREAWLRRTKATMLESVQGELPIDEVAARTLRGLIAALDAQVGAIYLSTATGELTRVAAFALAGKGTPTTFGPGEGLVGQVAASGQAMIVREVPAGFLRLEAGVGAGSVCKLALTPLRSEGKTVAVVAIGSLHAIDEVASGLLERIAEPLAVAFLSSQYKARLRVLLEDSQRQARELQAQQAELEAQQAELEASNEEMNQTNALMELQTQELERQRDDLAQARHSAEKASRFKSEFLANMSHELRTPLNSSLILARLLADNKEGNLTADQVRSAETIYSAGNDLLMLINDILDLAKIEAGRTEVVVEPVPLGRVLQSLEQAFAPIARDRRLGLRITRAAGSPETLITDSRRLEQILKNLLSNAFKFTAIGEVELTVAAAGAGRVGFAVRDTGIGIDPAQQEVIFEAFRQADGTTSRKYGGTGLGLSISRELARLLGGEIKVQSALGQGSTFTLVIPVAGAASARPGSGTTGATEVAGAARGPEKAAALIPAGAATARPAAAVREAAPRPDSARLAPPALADDRDKLTRPGRLILAVEDDAEFARILYDLAHDLDFDCVLAATADDGLALARELGPSGILLDVGLPDASGLSVLERLKREPGTRHIPIHMVSASDNVQTALELGAIGYALKPVAREGLVAAIKKLQERHARAVRRVLLVEDDLRQQESIQKLLSGEGVEILLAGSVKEALGELEHRSFDCMVLDLTLPDGSGYDLLEKMAQGSQYSFPPVIVYTGRELLRADEERLRRYSRSIIVKGARSPERLLDEVTLFLHQVESSLPAEQQRMLASARQREAVFEGRRILIVEDDVRNIFALSKVLESRGAKVEIARNGREALSLLGRVSPIDLVLMDLMMPEMDGLTAMTEIRKRPELKRLPIIALTAKAMADDREQALRAGADDYMAKPFEVDKLISLCRVWLPR